MLPLNGLSHQFPEYFLCPSRATYLFSCSGCMSFDLWTLPYSPRVLWVLTVLLCLIGRLETLLLHLQGLLPQQHEVLLHVCPQHSFRDTVCLGFSFSVLYIFFFIISMSAKFLPSDLAQHPPFRHKTQGTRSVMPTHAHSLPMPMPALCLCNSHHYLSVCSSS